MPGCRGLRGIFEKWAFEAATRGDFDKKEMEMLEGIMHQSGFAVEFDGAHTSCAARRSAKLNVTLAPLATPIRI